MKFHKEVQIQPIIHKNIQPVITTNIQPIIKEEIQPVVHKEIQQVIHHNIQPVITKKIQPIIQKKIQPVIFTENQTNIEEIIKQLEESDKQNEPKIIENHINKVEIAPQTKRLEKNSVRKKIVPYIMKVEQHSTKTEVEEKTETIYKTIEIIEYVPYIQYKNGEILPYEKKENISTITSSNMMETIIAVNFISLSYNINYPMACKKTDIFSKIEKKLYQEYPILKSKKIYFISNGNVIDKALTFQQNQINSGSTILINEIED